MTKIQKPTKKGLRLALEKERNEWNERFRVGSSVTIRPMSAEFDPRVTRTRSQAWIVCGNAVMVMVEGAPGVVALSQIVAAETGVLCKA